MRIRGIHLMGCVATLLCIEAVHAEMRHVEFKGTLTRVDSGTLLDGIVSVGMPFSGKITYDDEWEDFLPDDPHTGAYLDFETPPYEFEVSIGPVVFRPDLFLMMVLNDVEISSFYTSDFWSAGTDDEASVYVDGEYRETWEGVGISMLDNSSDAFKTDLLTEKIDLDEWGHKILTMYPWAYGPIIDGNITSFEYVPEPSSLAILLTGAMALIRRR